MKKFFLLLFFLISLALTGQEKIEIVKSTEIKEIDGKQYYIHHVQKGHTLYSISKVYEVSVKDLIFENPGSENGINIDEKLKIPLISREAEVIKSLEESDYDFFYHVARQGETFSDLSDIYIVPFKSLQLVNPELKEPFKEGEYVKIPVDIKTDENDESFENELEQNNLVSGENSQDYINHIVKERETLYRLSKMYNVEVHEILAFNPDLSHTLSIGQRIKIPVKSRIMPVNPDSYESESRDKKYINHEVVPGDDLYKIAIKYRVGTEEIKDLNPGLTDRIKIGQIIIIPDKTDDKGYVLHKVNQRRNKLSKLADLYDIDYEKLRMANPTAGNRLYFGQLIKIPLPRLPEKKIMPDTVKQLKTPILTEKLPKYDTAQPKYIKPDPDRVYNVALMLPLSLEEIDSLELSDNNNVNELLMSPSFRFVQFYEGFIIAVDSLVSRGLKLKLRLYDVDHDISKTIEVLQDPELTKTDLIIGPLFSKSFELASNFAHLFSIKIVNPFTKRSQVKDEKPLVYKVEPAIESQLEIVMDLISSKYQQANIIIVKGNKLQFNDELNAYKDSITNIIEPVVAIPNFILHNKLVDISRERVDDFKSDDQLLAALNIENKLLYRDDFSSTLYDSTLFSNTVKDVVYSEDGIDALLDKLSIVRKNLILVFSDDKVFTLDLLTNLNVLRDTFDLSVIGLPDWEELIDYSPELNQNVDLHLLTPSFLDYKNQHVINFINEFRERYKTEPQSMAYEGFDIGYYFLSALMKYGVDFDRFLPQHKTNLLKSKFNFYRSDPEGGWENSYWNFLYFNDFELDTIVNEKVIKSDGILE